MSDSSFSKKVVKTADRHWALKMRLSFFIGFFLLGILNLVLGWSAYPLFFICASLAALDYWLYRATTVSSG